MSDYVETTSGYVWPIVYWSTSGRNVSVSKITETKVTEGARNFSLFSDIHNVNNE